MRSSRLCGIVIALIGCGRVGFAPDRDGGGDSSTDGALPSVPGWATFIGYSPDPTYPTAVVEDPAGDVWVVGTTRSLGPNYQDGFVIKLDGMTGEKLAGGIRNFEAGRDTEISDAIGTTEGISVVGLQFDGAVNQSVAGAISTGASWSRTGTFNGDLTGINQTAGFYGLVAAANGTAVLVGETQHGNGSCTGCRGTDAVAVKVSETGVEWAVAFGSPFGDERFDRVIALPGGDLFAYGGDRGNYDYSLGAGTMIDTTPGLVARIALSTGSPVWARWPMPDAPGSALVDAFYDPASDRVVAAGHFDYKVNPFIAHISLDGAMTDVRRVILDGERGAVTAIVPADDGGVFLAGWERVSPAETQRHIYVARTTPSRDGIAWARRRTLGFTENRVGLVRSRRGDLLLFTAGGGPDGLQAMVARIATDGSAPACWELSSTSLQLVPVPVTSLAYDGTATPATTSFTDLTPESAPLETVMPPLSTCAP